VTEGPTDDSDVTLREYERHRHDHWVLHQQHQVAHDQRHAADQEAIRQQRENLHQQRDEDRDALRLAREAFDKQMEALEDKLVKRLDVVNGFRAEWLRERDRYLPRETFDAATNSEMRRLSMLEAFQNQADGKYLSQASFQEKLDEWNIWRAATDKGLNDAIDRETFDAYKEDQAKQRRGFWTAVGIIALTALANLLLNVAQNSVLP
jgi:hypothetical protein